MTDPVKQADGRAFLLPRAPFPHSSSPLRNTTNASSMKRPFGRKCRSSIGNRTCGPAAWSGSPGFRNLQNNSSHGLYNEIMHETDLIKKRLTRNGRAHMLPVLFLSFVAYAGRLQLLPSACAGVFQFSVKCIRRSVSTSVKRGKIRWPDGSVRRQPWIVCAVQSVPGPFRPNIGEGRCVFLTA